MSDESAKDLGGGRSEQSIRRRESVIAHVGGVETAGFREEMEDANTVEHPFRELADESFLAVYDGFCGSKGAQLAKEELHELFALALGQGKSPRQAMEEAFHLADKKIEAIGEDVGAAAAVIYVYGERVLVANVGDVRIVLERSRKAVRLTQDHKPDDAEERLRIEKAGGSVTESFLLSKDLRIPARVEGQLTMSRALGARGIGELVPAQPHINEFDLHRGDGRAILASDGLWSKIDDQEAVDLTRRMKYPKNAGEFLMREAEKRGSRDNITVIVVDFKQSALR